MLYETIPGVPRRIISAHAFGLRINIVTIVGSIPPRELRVLKSLMPNGKVAFQRRVKNTQLDIDIECL